MSRPSNLALAALAAALVLGCTAGERSADTGNAPGDDPGGKADHEGSETGDCLFGLSYANLAYNPNLKRLSAAAYADASDVPESDAAAILAGHAAAGGQASSLEDVFLDVDESRVDVGRYRNIEISASDTSVEYVSVSFGWGANWYGAVLIANDLSTAALITDSDFYDCAVFEAEDRWAMLSFELRDLQPELAPIGEPQAITGVLTGERPGSGNSLSAFSRDDALRAIREAAELSYDGYSVASLPTGDEEDLISTDFSPSYVFYLRKLLLEGTTIRTMEDPPTAAQVNAIFAVVETLGGEQSVDIYDYVHEVDSERYGRSIDSILILLHARDVETISVIRFPRDWN